MLSYTHTQKGAFCMKSAIVYAFLLLTTSIYTINAMDDEKNSADEWVILSEDGNEHVGAAVATAVTKELCKRRTKSTREEDSQPKNKKGAKEKTACCPWPWFLQ